MVQPQTPDDRRRRVLAAFCRMLATYHALSADERACIDAIAAGLPGMTRRDRDATLDTLDEILTGVQP